MNFEHIDYFMTCAACLNFSLAAKHHYVSVSTLSRGINALEDKLGVKLFERGYHGHSLTVAGQEFFNCCVKNSVEMNRYTMRWCKPERDIFRIGCCDGNSAYEKLIVACAKMPADYLPKNVKIIFLAEDDWACAIEKGFIDAVVMEMKEEPYREGIKTAEFFTEGDKRFVFAGKGSIDDSILKKLSSLKRFL